MGLNTVLASLETRFPFSEEMLLDPRNTGTSLRMSVLSIFVKYTLDKQFVDKPIFFE